ncbi:MAG TPA: hypothetical protein VH117_06265 [Edaphobacter sp.]|jgi:hypothetical protein|nr:hypothetical protein [Edaphobacter sp.]
MRGIFAKCFVAMGVGLAAIAVQGCKKKPAPVPVQTVVRSAPRVQPDFPGGYLPVEDVNPAPRPRYRAARPQQVQQPTQLQNTGGQNEAVAAAQKLQDARLLQQQQAASQRQQEELNQEIEEEMKRQQDVQAEPRIQEIPTYDQPMQPQIGTPQF